MYVFHDVPVLLIVDLLVLAFFRSQVTVAIDTVDLANRPAVPDDCAAIRRVFENAADLVVTPFAAFQTGDAVVVQAGCRVLAAIASNTEVEDALDYGDTFRNARHEANDVAFSLADHLVAFQNPYQLSIRAEFLFTSVRHPAEGSQYLAVGREMLPVVPVWRRTARSAVVVHDIGDGTANDIP